MCFKLCEHSDIRSNNNEPLLSVVYLNRLHRKSCLLCAVVNCQNSFLLCIGYSRLIHNLILLDLFMISKEVEQSLANHETTKCLAWCHDNRSKLRKLRSTMEFNLRIQEFIELVRQDKRFDAVKLV